MENERKQAEFRSVTSGSYRLDAICSFRGPFNDASKKIKSMGEHQFGQCNN